MEIIKPVQSHLWWNKYSECAKNGAIVQWLGSLKNCRYKLVLPHGDGLRADNARDYLSLIGQNSDAIVGVLVSQQPHPVTNKILYLPLDDETFQHGLKYIISRDAGDRADLQWEQRKPVAFWRGVPSVFRIPFVKQCYGCPNTDLLGVKTPWGNTEIGIQYFDPRYNGYDGRPVPFREHFEYKYLLIMDGFMVASNLQWVFGSGAVPILITHPDNEFWFKQYIQPDVNCVVVDPTDHNAGDILKAKIQYLVNHDDEAKKIAQQARLLADEIFSSRFQKSYLLKSLADFGMFTGDPNPAINPK
jgi:hypothetical protein